jgi:hypothetical protein
MGMTSPFQILIDYYINIEGNSLKYIKARHPVEYNNLLKQTNFLPDDANARRRMWHVVNDVWEIPKCTTCANEQYYSLKNKKYIDHCLSCFKQYRPDRDLAKQTMQQRYGASTTFESPLLKSKAENTNIERYGHKSPFGNNLVKEKIKSTNIEKYGKPYYTLTNTLITLNKNLHINKDSYDDIVEQRTNTIIEKYDRTHYNLIKYSDDTIAKINDREWLYEMIVVRAIPAYKLCQDFLEGYDDSSLWVRLKKFGIEPNYENFKSYAEIELGEVLDTIGIAYESNSRKYAPPYELDIYIPKYNLAIEYCGLYWHSDSKKDKIYHKRKYDICKNNGIRLLTIFEDEWINHKHIVIDKIKHIVNKSNSPRVYARKCTIETITKLDKKIFFDNNHIQGDGPSSINIGLINNGHIVAVMGIIVNAGRYVLNRYATDSIVVGGFSKLLSFFRKSHIDKPLITFADLRWSQGDLYHSTGFIMDKIIPVDYSWVKGNYRYHKFNFRHSGMKLKLNNYDSSLSEDANMRNNGYRKIWDCGKIRFKID